MIRENILDLKTSETKKVISNFLGKKLVLLVGSAISQYDPTSIPSGGSFSSKIADILCNSFDDSEVRSGLKKLLYSNANPLPFEFYTEMCPRKEILKTELINQFYPKLPNNVHKGISSLLLNNTFSHIITTNYDLGIEDSGLLQPPYYKIVTKNDSKNIGMNPHVYFKIHGSAEPKYDQTVVFSLSQEKIMLDWKRSLLHTCLKNSLLIVIGYSGYDFEVCLEILKSDLQGLIWNCRDYPGKEFDNMSQNAKMLLSGIKNSFVVYGDMIDLLNYLGCSIKPSMPIKNKLNWDLEKKLTKNELQNWALLLTLSPGYVKLPLLMTNEIRKTTKIGSFSYARLVNFRGDLLFSKGKYSKAIKSLNLAINIYKKQITVPDYFKEYVRSNIKKIECLRCSMRLFKANLLLNKVLEMTKMNKKNEDLYIELLRQRVMIRNSLFFNIIKILPLKRLKFLHKQTIADLKRIVNYSVINGFWDKIYNVRLICDRINIKFEEVYENLKLLDTGDGYKSLGFFVPSNISSRLKADKNYKIAQDLKINIDKLIESDCYPEAYKTILKISKKTNKASLKSKWSWIKPFSECEYAFLYKGLKGFSNIIRTIVNWI